MPDTPIQTTPSGPQLEPRKTGHRWLDLTVAGAAILISVISLVVAVQQGRVQQQMLAAGSWPILVSETGNIDPETRNLSIKMTVRNDGAGPALLRWIEVRYNGRPVSGYQDLLNRCCLAGRRYGEVFVTSTQLGRSVLAPGKSLDWFELQRTDDNIEVWDALNRERFRITYDACYCSVLGECWRSSLDGGEPRRIKACPKEGGYRE